MSTATRRNFALDNLKGFLIVLVVVGHASGSCGNNEICQWLWCVIYSFHMPAFVAISGYVSSERKGMLNACRRLLPLYVIGQMSWIVYRHALDLDPHVMSWLHDIKQAFYLPIPTLWYILSLFFWRATVPLLAKIRHALLSLLFLMAVGTAIGTVYFVGETFSLSRTITLFPFFAAGFWARRISWFDVRRSFSLFEVMLMAGRLPCWLFVLIQGHVMPDLLYMGGPFSAFAISLPTALLFRMAYYVSAFAVIQGLWLMTTANAGWVADLGKNSLSIYLGHIYVLWTLMTWVSVTFWQGHPFLMIFGVTLLSCSACSWLKIGYVFEYLSELFVRKVVRWP